MKVHRLFYRKEGSSWFLGQPSLQFASYMQLDKEHFVSKLHSHLRIQSPADDRQDSRYQ